MKGTKKTAPEKVEEEEEEYSLYESALIYIIEKLVFVVKDGGRVHIDNLMSGKPKDPPPY